jgi:hypothetical protein
MIFIIIPVSTLKIKKLPIALNYLIPDPDLIQYTWVLMPNTANYYRAMDVWQSRRTRTGFNGKYHIIFNINLKRLGQ